MSRLRGLATVVRHKPADVALLAWDLLRSLLPGGDSPRLTWIQWMNTLEAWTIPELRGEFNPEDYVETLELLKGYDPDKHLDEAIARVAHAEAYGVEPTETRMVEPSSRAEFLEHLARAFEAEAEYLTDPAERVRSAALAKSYREDLAVHAEISEALANDTGNRGDLADLARKHGFDPAEFGLAPGSVENILTDDDFAVLEEDREQAGTEWVQPADEDAFDRKSQIQHPEKPLPYGIPTDVRGVKMPPSDDARARRMLDASDIALQPARGDVEMAGGCPHCGAGPEALRPMVDAASGEHFSWSCAACHRRFMRAPHTPEEIAVVVGRIEATLTVPTTQKASLLGVSESTWRRWASGAATPGEEHQRRLRRLDRVLEPLRSVMRPAGAAKWLCSPHAALGRTPLEVILDEDPGELDRLLELLASARLGGAS